MPFPGKERFITVIAQHFGEGDLLGTQVPVILGRQMGGVASAPAPHLARGVTDPSRNAVLRRVFAGENAGARGTANLARRLTTGELHADGGDAVDVRALIISGPLVAKITPT